jgi:hypothetical protein
LNQPYPFFYESIKRILITAGAFVIGVALFLYLIQPFSYNFDEHRYPFWIISLMNGLLVGILFVFYMSMIKGFAPRLIEEEYWTLGRELFFWLIFLLMVGVGNFFLRELIYDNPNNFSFHYFRTEVIHSLIVGSFFLLFIVTGKYLHIVTITADKASSWNRKVSKYRNNIQGETKITVRAESEQDTIHIKVSDFLYAKVDGNYIEFYLLNENEEIEKQIKRNTLSSVEEQLRGVPNIIRVHRSYLVNIYKIDSVTGNAQGYRLSIKKSNDIIPVSRSYIPVFDTAMS